MAPTGRPRYRFGISAGRDVNDWSNILRLTFRLVDNYPAVSQNRLGNEVANLLGTGSGVGRHPVFRVGAVAPYLAREMHAMNTHADPC